MKPELQRRRRRPVPRTISTIVAFCIPPALGWYAGYDMLARGGEPAGCMVLSFALAVFTCTCPSWTRERRYG